MRKGKNTSKNEIVDVAPSAHRIIIPLYIPVETEYYKESFEIFEMCLYSLHKTSFSPIKVSVISNGCSNNINTKLTALYIQGYINELIIEKDAIGKINSILKALRTAQERLITITDGDVLFLNNWEQEILKIFKAFPKAGMVSPVPMYRTQYRHTANIWFDYLFSNKLKFRAVKNPEALTRFANSIGWRYLNEKVKDVIASVEAKDGTLAVIGNSHFVGTYKKEVFEALPKEQSKYRLGGSSEQNYTDSPVLKMGGYRLATNDNFAYHLGNTKEEWMQEQFNLLKKEEKIFNSFKELRTLNSSPINYFFTSKIFKKLLFWKPFKKLIYKRKGLNKTQVNTFINAEY